MNHTTTSHAAQAGIDLDKLRAAFEAEAPSYKINTARSLRSPDAYKYEFAEHMWELVQAVARNAACAAPEADEKHLPGWERGIATVTMTGHQLRAALDFLNPDGDDDEDQRDGDLTFGIVQHKDDNGAVTTGLCCWNDDTDGVLPLDAYPDAAASPAPETVQADDVEQITHERDALANAIRDAAVKAGIVRTAASMTGPQLVMLCNDLAAPAHAQQDAAPADVTEDGLKSCPFCGGMNIDPAEWVANDGSKGPGCGDCGATAENASSWNRRVPTSPSAATGKAAAANAGGLDDDALYNAIINLHPELHRHIEYKRGHDAACIEAANLVLNRISATGAANAKDAARYRFLRDVMAFDKPAGQPTTMTLRAPIHAPDHDVHKDWISDRFIASVDQTVDAAIAASQKGGA